MKFYIAVDCEGVACGVGAPGGSLNASRNLEFCKLQATREADAAARALFDEGAERVIVWDNHNGSLNLHYDLLDERCDIALGQNFPHRFPGLDESFAGVLFIGYHARDNTERATMCHTFSSAAYQYQKINGVEVGELAIDAAVAGTYGVPPIFVASDQTAVAEAKEFFPGISTVTTKEAFSWNAAVSKHPKRVLKEIYDTVRKAVKHAETPAPFRFTSPIRFEIRFKRIDAADAASLRGNGWSRIDAHTVERRLEKITDFY
jgi:D-amino peptidase